MREIAKRLEALEAALADQDGYVGPLALACSLLADVEAESLLDASERGKVETADQEAALHVLEVFRAAFKSCRKERDAVRSFLRQRPAERENAKKLAMVLLPLCKTTGEI